MTRNRQANFYRLHTPARDIARSVRQQRCAMTGTCRAFTLIEILIVVVILGILAALVVPQFSNASHLARENALKDDLRYLRTQIGVYKAQHEDIAPGYPDGDSTQSPEADWFVKHLTGYSNKQGAYSASPSPDYPFGPYLTRLPANPINSREGIWVYTGGSDMPVPDASVDAGWIYNPGAQQIIANLPGNDGNGVPYADY